MLRCGTGGGGKGEHRKERGRVMCGRKCVIEVGARLGNTVIEVLVKGYG